MVRTASLFSQLLDLFPRNQFQRSVKAHRAERYMKGFNVLGTVCGNAVLPVGASAFVT